MDYIEDDLGSLRTVGREFQVYDLALKIVEEWVWNVGLSIDSD